MAANEFVSPPPSHPFPRPCYASVQEELAWLMVGEHEEKVAERGEEVAVKESEIKR